uniref:Epidermal growth factor-like domain-containing protein n=1 Tax=Aplanochytrium stocchinoi TaxID=215587 RepID=A0A6S8BN91_9STRA
MSTSCLSLSSSGPCGHFGICVNSTLCVCDPGWSHGNEWSFFVKPDQVEASLCNINTSIVLAQNLFIFIFSASAFLSIVASVMNMKQLKRSVVLLVGLSFYIFMSMYRIISPKDALFGRNILVTFLFSNSFLMYSLESIRVFNKYLTYLSKSFILASSRVRFQATALLWLGNCRYIFDTVFLQLIWVSAVVYSVLENVSGARLVIRISLAYSAFIYVNSALLLVVSQQVIKDMKEFASAGFVKTHSKPGSDISNMVAMVKAEISRAKSVRISNFVYICLNLPKEKTESETSQRQTSATWKLNNVEGFQRRYYSSRSMFNGVRKRALIK